jgi:hypothetical protein
VIQAQARRLENRRARVRGISAFLASEHRRGRQPDYGAVLAVKSALLFPHSSTSKDSLTPASLQSPGCSSADGGRHAHLPTMVWQHAGISNEATCDVMRQASERLAMLVLYNMIRYGAASAAYSCAYSGWPLHLYFLVHRHLLQPRCCLFEAAGLGMV